MDNGLLSETERTYIAFAPTMRINCSIDAPLLTDRRCVSTLSVAAVPLYSQVQGASLHVTDRIGL